MFINSAIFCVRSWLVGVSLPLLKILLQILCVVGGNAENAISFVLFIFVPLLLVNFCYRYIGKTSGKLKWSPEIIMSSINWACATLAGDIVVSVLWLYFFAAYITTNCIFYDHHLSPFQRHQSLLSISQRISDITHIFDWTLSFGYSSPKMSSRILL